jgi:hypothetical protein
MDDDRLALVITIGCVIITASSFAMLLLLL